MSDSIIETAIAATKAAALPVKSTGGGGGVDEAPSNVLEGPGFETQSAPEPEFIDEQTAMQRDPGPDPMNQEIQRAANRMRDITSVASRLLEAYITSGGTYTSLGSGHIEKSYQIAADFVALGENIWGSTIHQILNPKQDETQRSVIIA